MKIILLQDCKDGAKDTIIEKPLGYAKNYLIKNGLAVPFNDINEKELKKRIQVKDENYLKEYQEALQLKDEIEKITLNFSLKTTNDVIHGSITQKKINLALIEKGIKLKKHSLVDVHIASIGTSIVKVKLFEKVMAELKIIIAKEK
ncbi:MAG: 50S ribosomal protein L9 [Metamycoplasmataceae bacterium]